MPIFVPRVAARELPNCRITTGLVGIDCDGWVRVHGWWNQECREGETAGWSNAVVSPTRSFFFFFFLEGRRREGTVTRDRGRPAFEGAASTTNSTAEITGFVEAMRTIF